MIAGAANGDALAGTSPSSANPIGITVTATRARRVPDTIGVTTRLSSASFAANPNWQRAVATTSAPRSGGPPTTRARTATPIDAPEAPMTSRFPAPMPATRLACRTVVSPPITRLAKIAQARYASPRLAARTAMVVTTTNGVQTRIAVWSPRTTQAGCGGGSSAA